jgi:hypothetical protein
VGRLSSWRSLPAFVERDAHPTCSTAWIGAHVGVGVAERVGAVCARLEERHECTKGSAVPHQNELAVVGGEGVSRVQHADRANERDEPSVTVWVNTLAPWLPVSVEHSHGWFETPPGSWSWTRGLAAVRSAALRAARGCTA